MELYVDIADIDVIEEIAQYFPIDGFTTNPKIFTQAKRPITELMAAYKTYAEKNKVKVFIQVTGATATEMYGVVFSPGVPGRLLHLWQNAL